VDIKGDISAPSEVMSHFYQQSITKRTKQNKSNDLEVSALPTEDVTVDELARHVYYTAKAIR
jgi:hypothetical protein